MSYIYIQYYTLIVKARFLQTSCAAVGRGSQGWEEILSHLTALGKERQGAMTPRAGHGPIDFPGGVARPGVALNPRDWEFHDMMEISGSFMI